MSQRSARRYDTEYTRFYDRPVPGSDVEIMSYAVVVASVVEAADDTPAPGAAEAFAPEATAARHQAVRDTLSGEVADWAVFDRSALRSGRAGRGAGDHRRGRDLDAGRAGVDARWSTGWAISS